MDKGGHFCWNITPIWIDFGNFTIWDQAEWLKMFILVQKEQNVF